MAAAAAAAGADGEETEHAIALVTNEPAGNMATNSSLSSPRRRRRRRRVSAGRCVCALSGPAIRREGRTDGSDRAPSAGLELENTANYILIKHDLSASVCACVCLHHCL